ncbi:MAG: response regulator [Candidatus Dormibacteraeota bacterium]|nr:response regulator [Candidatus Dormibacteraeota bacterium]
MARVLLVEDDSAIAALYALKLRLDGYSVQVAGDSAAARDCVERELPDVICLDVRLPDGSGGELAGSLAAAGARVILLTNDEHGFRNPPPLVARALLKAETSPSQLSAAIANLLKCD